MTVLLPLVLYRRDGIIIKYVKLVVVTTLSCSTGYCCYLFPNYCVLWPLPKLSVALHILLSIVDKPLTVFA